jgi:hypothetical protein
MFSVLSIDNMFLTKLSECSGEYKTKINKKTDTDLL